MTDIIPESELVVGAIYEIRARNFSVAVWTGKAMRGPRWKFDNLYLFDEYLAGNPENGIFGTVYPKRRLSEDFEIEDGVLYGCPLIDPDDFDSITLLVALNAAQWMCNERRNLESAISAAGLEIELDDMNWPRLKGPEDVVLAKNLRAIEEALGE